MFKYIDATRNRSLGSLTTCVDDITMELDLHSSNNFKPGSFGRDDSWIGGQFLSTIVFIKVPVHAILLNLLKQSSNFPPHS